MYNFILHDSVNVSTLIHGVLRFMNYMYKHTNDEKCLLVGSDILHYNPSPLLHR